MSSHVVTITFLRLLLLFARVGFEFALLNTQLGGGEIGYLGRGGGEVGGRRIIEYEAC